MTESAPHDLLASSNPDTQALLRVITGLAGRVEALTALVSALQFEIDTLPEQFVIPGPEGQIPQVVDRAPIFAPLGSLPTGTAVVPVEAQEAVLSDVGHYGAGIPTLEPVSGTIDETVLGELGLALTPVDALPETPLDIDAQP